MSSWPSMPTRSGRVLEKCDLRISGQSRFRRDRAGNSSAIHCRGVHPANSRHSAAQMGLVGIPAVGGDAGQWPAPPPIIERDRWNRATRARSLAPRPVSARIRVVRWRRDQPTSRATSPIRHRPPEPTISCQARSQLGRQSPARRSPQALVEPAADQRRGRRPHRRARPAVPADLAAAAHQTSPSSSTSPVEFAAPAARTARGPRADGPRAGCRVAGPIRVDAGRCGSSTGRVCRPPTRHRRTRRTDVGRRTAPRSAARPDSEKTRVRYGLGSPRCTPAIGGIR